MKILVVLMWLSFLPRALHAGNPLPISEDDTFGPAGPVPEGAAVSLELPATAKIGDAIKGRFIICNTGTKPFVISTGFDYRGSGVPLRLKVRVTDSEGRVLTDMAQGLPCLGGLGGDATIEPGKSHEIACPFQAYVTFTDAGTYVVEACHDLGWKVDDTRPHPVAKTKIKIVLPSPEQATARVRELCMGTDEDVKWQLFKLQHPSFLPALMAEAEAGRSTAVIGISGIPSKGATEALLKLLVHSSPEVVTGAARELTGRLPSLEDGSKSAFHNMYVPPPRDALLKTWDSKYRGQLLEAAHRFLQSTDKETIALGASFITAQGGSDDAPALLATIDRIFERNWEIRAGKDANVIDPPAPLGALFGALDSLRARGWRTDGGPDRAARLAHFRQLADPKMARPADDRWKQSILAIVDQDPLQTPSVFRENAVRAIPVPVPDEFVKPLLKAFDDQDWAVVMAACEVAGKSGRKIFIPGLAQIVETMHHFFVQNAAHNAAVTLGARTELWTAWCEVITDQDRMHDAVNHLVIGTIDLPPSDGYGGNSNFTREQRFAIRDGWRAFLAKHRDLLAKGGRIPMDDPSITPLLTGANFNPDQPVLEIHLKDRTSWPPPSHKPR